MGLDEILTASVFASAIRLATPYIFAALGETFAQRSGVLNLGVDGMMLMGAFTGFYAVHLAQQGETISEPASLLLGVAVALIVGGLMGLAMAFVSVTLKAKQGISGIGVYLFGLGLSELLFQQWVGTPKSVNGFPRIEFPLLTDLPVVGDIFFHHNLLVYVAFVLVPISAYVLNNTTFGSDDPGRGAEPGGGRRDGRQRGAGALCHDDDRRHAGGPGGGVALDRADQFVPAESDSGTRLHRRRPGILRWLAALDGSGGGDAFQFCQRAAIADQGDRGGHSVGVRGDGALCDYDHCAGLCYQASRAADRPDQAL